MTTPEEIEVTIFDKPANNVRGMINAFVTVKGKPKRVAHATLLVGEEPSVSVSLPSTLPLDQIEGAAQILSKFVAKVREHSQPE